MGSFDRDQRRLLVAISRGPVLGMPAGDTGTEK
jgi:hypothetical protein